VKVVHDIRIDFQSTPQWWLAYREGTEFGEDSRPVYGLGKTPVIALAELLTAEMDREDEMRPAS
jgi:hypothetical protein